MQCSVYVCSNSGNIPQDISETVQCITITPWSESASELDRSRDRSLSAKIVTTFADINLNYATVQNISKRVQYLY
jgi:hypothetical protein